MQSYYEDKLYSGNFVIPCDQSIFLSATQSFLALLIGNTFENFHHAPCKMSWEVALFTSKINEIAWWKFLNIFLMRTAENDSEADWKTEETTGMIFVSVDCTLIMLYLRLHSLHYLYHEKTIQYILYIKYCWAEDGRLDSLKGLERNFLYPGYCLSGLVKLLPPW